MFRWRNFIITTITIITTGSGCFGIIITTIIITGAGITTTITITITGTDLVLKASSQPTRPRLDAGVSFSFTSQLSVRTFAFAARAMWR